jgi:tetratricopeptide (TPR) repeat protein
LSHLDRAIEENPLLPEVQLARGELLLAAGAPKAAYTALEAAANLLHDDAQLEGRLGQALLAIERSEDALTHLRAAVAGGFTPDDIERALALALALNGKLAESERVLSQAGIADNQDSEVIRGLIRFERKTYAAAEEILRPVVTARANEPGILNLFSAVLYNQTRYQEAIGYLEDAEEIDPTAERIVVNLSVARAARAAELLAKNATTVKAAPTK